jgi:hypothetical protein
VHFHYSASPIVVSVSLLSHDRRRADSVFTPRTAMRECNSSEYLRVIVATISALIFQLPDKPQKILRALISIDSLYRRSLHARNSLASICLLRCGLALLGNE